MSPNCPSPDELSDFALGKLPDERSESVAHHIEECTPCQATLGGLDNPSDTLVNELRKPFSADPVEQQAECRQAVERIQALAPELARPPAGGSAADAPSQLTADTQAAHTGATPGQQSPPAPEGRVWGEYTVLERLGAGGMGEVFKARHRRMNRIVAIKVLPAAAMRSPEAVKRFEREVEAAARLSHPNIVAAYDAGEQDGVHYLVMEYVPGRDLSSLLRERGPLPPAEAVGYILQAARGLAYAHAKGVVHRDIKPANLLLDDEGTVKVLDMGLARFDDAAGAVLTAAQEGLTQSGQVMGTVDYMAPEQAFDTRHADARADIYSLGCTLYRLLTGENLYGGETLVQKLLAHREQPIPSLRAARSEVPEALDGILVRMVAKQPQDRYASMSELVRELESIHLAQSSHLVPRDEPHRRHHAPRDASHHAERDAYGAQPKAQPSFGKGSSRGARWLLYAAGACILLAGIVIIIRNQQGEEVARVTAPEGSTVSIERSGSKPLDKPPTKPSAPATGKPPSPSIPKPAARKPIALDAPLWTPPVAADGMMLFRRAAPALSVYFPGRRLFPDWASGESRR